jgi:mono/diheme cytochrome c family protein
MRFGPRQVSAVALSLAVTLGRLPSSLANDSLGGEKSIRTLPPIEQGSISRGRSLFLKNCAHCHGEDATGDEGPDLHGIKHSDAWIEKRIRNGIKGEMPAFQEKFNATDIAALMQFLKSLK